MSAAGTRVRGVLSELLGADPVDLLSAGRPKAGLVPTAQSTVRTAIHDWPIAWRDHNSAVHGVERLALQIDRAADWVARGPEAIAMLTEQRRELELAALAVNVGPLHCPGGLRAFGDGPRFIQHAGELAARCEHLLSVLERRLEELDAQPVIPDRSFPPDIDMHAGEAFAQMSFGDDMLPVRAIGNWDLTDHTLMHLRVTVAAPDGNPAALLVGRLRMGSLELADLPSPDLSIDEILGHVNNAPAQVLLVDDLVVAAAYAGQQFGPQLVLATATGALDPRTLVVVVARPRANRLPAERRERLVAYWHAAGWVPIAAGLAWLVPSSEDAVSNDL